MTDDDRVDCANCAHLYYRRERVKRPPFDPSLDPQTAYQTAEVELERCARKHTALPGHLRRCPDFRQAVHGMANQRRQS